MARTPTNLDMEQGTTFSVLATWKDTTGRGKDLTYYNARMQIRPSYGSTTITESLSTANGEIVLSATGEISFVLPPARTSRIPVDYNQTARPPKTAYVYDLELIDPEGDVTRLLYGSIIVTGEVTR